MKKIIIFSGPGFKEFAFLSNALNESQACEIEFEYRRENNLENLKGKYQVMHIGRTHLGTKLSSNNEYGFIARSSDNTHFFIGLYNPHGRGGKGGLLSNEEFIANPIARLIVYGYPERDTPPI